MEPNTFYIDCSQDKSNSESDSVFIYKLKDTLQLPQGTTISSQSAHINKKGQQGTINLERDYEESLIIQYYVNPDGYLSPKDKGDPPYFTRSFVIDELEDLVDNASDIPVLQRNFYASFDESTDQQPFILCKKNGTTIKPIRNKIRIKVNKGVYGITQLADIITKQINGYIDINDTNEFSKIEQEINSNQFKGYPVQKSDENNATPITIVSVVEDQGIYDFGSPTCDDIFVNSFTYYNMTKLQQTNVANTDFNYANLRANTIDGLGTFGKGLCSLWTNKYANVDEDDYNFTRNGVAIGTSNFTLNFNEKNNGYEFTYLHEPMRIQNFDNLGNKLPNAGSECVVYKKPLDSYLEGITNRDILVNTKTTPLARIGGIIVSNWCFRTSYLNGTKNGKKNNKSIDDCLPLNMNNFFNNEDEAKRVWENTLWFKLGFTYEDLNKKYEKPKIYDHNMTTLCESLGISYNDEYSLLGTTTNGNINDQTVINTISSDNNPQDVTVDGGLVTNLKQFGLYDTAYSKSNVDKVQLVGSLYDNFTVYYAITQSQGLSASQLPTLDKYGYYLIDCSIIDTTTYYGNGERSNILTIVDKNGSNDFNSQTEQMIHTLSNSKFVNNIKFRVLNPDGSEATTNGLNSITLRIDLPEPNQSK